MNYHDYSTAQFEQTYTYFGSDLGSVWSKDKTTFRVWAPAAEAIEVHLFHSGDGNANDQILKQPMQSDKNGTWVAEIPGNLNGIYYTYKAWIQGKWVESCDPYARASGVNSRRSMVIDLSYTNPAAWEQDHAPKLSGKITDYVIYEAHIRDFTKNRFSRIKQKGKFLGLTEEGTETAQGYPTGLNYLKQLGVTHIHLLPVFDFGSVDETDVDGKQYNWGYDPVAFNIPEGSYASNPFDGFTRIREMKEMVSALHRNGLAVIMDVVYNHVYHTDEFSINRLVPGYFSRQDENGVFSNGSICGNDTASERSMVRKYIVDSVNYWADEYHIDGFRFDLVGLLDVTTIQQIISTVHRKHPHVIFYGEGWDMQTSVTKPNTSLAIQRNALQLPNFAFFNDTIRDTMRGSTFDTHALGFISGGNVSKWDLLNRFCGKTDWTDDPKCIINYVSCHDNHTLYDRISEALPYASQHEIARRCRLGGAFNLLSLGVPFFQAGEELLRRKTNRNGKIISNSYRSPDSVNAIKWNTLAEEEVNTTLAYYRGILALRRKHPVFRMDDPEEILKNVTLWDTESDEITAFLLHGSNEEMLVVFHPGVESSAIRLPKGTWSVLVTDNFAGTEIIKAEEWSIEIPALSAAVLVKQV